MVQPERGDAGSRGLNSAEFSEDAAGFGARVRGAGDLAADDEVSGSGGDGFGGSGDALLIALPGPGAAHSGGDDDGIGAEDGAHAGGFERRANDAIDGGFLGFADAECDEVFDGTGIAEVGEIGLIEAGEDGDAEEAERCIGAAFDSGAHDGVAAVYGEQVDAEAGDLGGGSLHGFGDVVKLEIEEDFVAGVEEFVDEGDAGGGVEFHADFVESGGVPDGADEGAGFVRGGDVEGYDDGVVHRM